MKWRTWLHWLLMPANGRTHAHDEELCQRSLAEQRREDLRRRLLAVEGHGAARWNERIRIDPLKLSPRASPAEPHCRWSIRLGEERVDYAAEPGEYVREHGLQRETDAEIVNHEAGKYARKGKGTEA